MSQDGARRRIRDPDGTRARILTEAFNLFYRNGFRGTSLSDVLSAAQLTKGALYHHFSGKSALGYAVVDEVLVKAVERLRSRLRSAGDPLAALVAWLRTPMGDVLMGCPVNNLAMEMSSVDPVFREKLDRVFELWLEALSETVTRAQEMFLVRLDVKPEAVAAFILASYEGAVSLARNAGSQERFDLAVTEVTRYLATLGWE